MKNLYYINSYAANNNSFVSKVENLGVLIHQEKSRHRDEPFYYIECDEETAKKLIPQNTDYCKGCPFHDLMFECFQEQSNGWCHFMKTGDMVEGGTFLLWDGCKECGVNSYEDIEEPNA